MGAQGFNPRLITEFQAYSSVRPCLKNLNKPKLATGRKNEGPRPFKNKTKNEFQS